MSEVSTGRVGSGGALEGKEGFDRAMSAYDYRRALDVAQSWLKSEPNEVQAGIAVALANNALADMTTNAAESAGYIDRSLVVLKSMLNEPGETRGLIHFLYAEALGMRVRSQGTSAIQLLPTIAEEAELSVKLIADYEDGAPQRLLGTLLVKAPAWPQGPGDADRGMKILQSLIEKYPRRAEGYILYADVLLDESKVADAQRYLARAKDLVGKSPRARKLWLDVESRVKTNRKVKQYE